MIIFKKALLLFIIIAMVIVLPLSASATETDTKYIYIGDQLVAIIQGTGEVDDIKYIHTDHLGGTQVVTKTTDVIDELIDYYPFGENRFDVQNHYNSRKKFTGHEFDSDTQLNYMGARYQAGKTGRFISQDPVFQAVGDPNQIKQMTKLEMDKYLADPQQLNSYSYVRNNPPRNIDPSGKFFLDLVSLGLSINDYRQEPSLANAAFVGLDALGAAIPGVPAVGILKHTDDVSGTVKNINRARESGLNIIRFGLEYTKNIGFRMDSRIWSQGDIGDNLGSLVDHYVRHGDAVGANSVSDYYSKANQFIDSGKGIKMQAENGFEIWDPLTNTLGVVDQTGNTIRSFYQVIDTAKINNLNQKVKSLK
jgi:RHS repeat-associated protein